MRNSGKINTVSHLPSANIKPAVCPGCQSSSFSPWYSTEQEDNSNLKIKSELMFELQFCFKFSVWFWLESYMLTGRISSSDRNRWLRCTCAFSCHITGCRILPRSSQGSPLRILLNVPYCTASLCTLLTSKWQCLSWNILSFWMFFTEVFSSIYIWRLLDKEMPCYLVCCI